MCKHSQKSTIRIITYLALFLIFIIWWFGLRKIYDFPCLIYLITGFECPSCGATRALKFIFQGNLSQAAACNPVFTFAIYPIGFLLVAQDIFICLYNIIKKSNKQSLLEFAVKGRKL